MSVTELMSVLDEIKAETKKQKDKEAKTNADRAAVRKSVVSSFQQISDTLKQKVSDTEYDAAMGEIRNVASYVRMEFEDPPLIEEIRQQAAERGDDAKGVVSKIVARIPKFAGDTEKYTWDHFITCFKIAVGNASYKDYELCTIFLNCLEGNALEHYRAHQDSY